MRLRERVDGDVAALHAIAELTAANDRYPPHWSTGMTHFPAPRIRSDELAAYVAVAEGDQPIAHIALHAASADGASTAAANAAGIPAAQLAVVARLFVHPNHRGLGLAEQLLARVVGDADRLGRRPILDVWSELPRAIALYEKCGWERLADIEIRFRSRCTNRCAHEGSSINSHVYAWPSS